MKAKGSFLATYDTIRKIRAIWETKTGIRTHLESIPQIKELAERCDMSERSFHRYFEKATGKSPAAYIQYLRLARGAAWLAYGNATIIEAALAAGYESREAFSRHFKACYNCTPQEFRRALHAQVAIITKMPPPKELHILGLQNMQEMSLLARPHFGAALSTVAAWRDLGVWCKGNAILQPETQPVTVIYDDPATLPPNTQERYDAALTVNPDTVPEEDGLFIHYTIPGGMYAVAVFTGSLMQIERAWDYFSYCWFLKSGLQMRESRFIMLHRQEDIPSSPLAAAKLLAGKKISCRLCIPADKAPGYDVPVLKRYDQ